MTIFRTLTTQDSPHDRLARRPQRRALILIVGLRSLFISLLVAALDYFVPLGTSLWGLSVSAVGGILLATIVAFRGINSLGMCAIILFGLALYQSVFSLLGYLPIDSPSDPFVLYSWREHANLMLVSGYLGLISTWAFWRFRWVLTLEFIGLAALGLSVMTGHRNLRLDRPQLLNDLAWNFGVEPLTMIVALGIGLLTLLIVYLFCTTIPARPDPRVSSSQQFLHDHRADRRRGLVMLAIFAAAFLIVVNGTYRHFETVLRENPPEGVGMAEKNSEGISPLDFSGQGTGNNQVAAMVRLEGDYGENPFSPTLYLRESALSDFNGRELVMAGNAFDRDVSGSSPDEGYALEPAPSFLDSNRKKITQSIYLLANHKLAFGIDFPYLIRPLKNINPERFKQVYRAYSYAPTVSRESLLDLAVGDPSWSESTRKHYLVTHPDGRYAALAAAITAGVSEPVQQASLITEFLSAKSTYTLTPNHEVPKDSDPVAPYLFGDFRGYCVHFAHATTYMLRSLGIPARIGTGYMTDLSQSKDGHILLRMSDRHAWAEVYVQGLGWVPFDTQPAKVENHADTPVDMKLLEELMGMVDPGEELLGKDLLKDEQNIEAPTTFHLPDARSIFLPIILTGIGLLLAKLFLLYGHLVTTNPETRLRRLYRAMVTRLYDLGVRRLRGETREEFRARVEEIVGHDSLAITPMLNAVTYGDNSAAQLDSQLLERSYTAGLSGIVRIPRWRRVIASMNPASVFAIPFGGRW